MSADVLAFERRPAAGPPTDADLMRACGQGDTEALGQLFDRHHVAVHRFALRLVQGHAADADDIVQQTFLTAHRGAHRFDGRAGARAWLLGIAAQHARHRRRSFARVARLLASLRAQPMASPRSPERAAADHERLARLEAAIDRLPARAREVFLLCEVEQVRGVDAAIVLGAPEGTIYRRLHDARRRLRALLPEDAR